MASTPPSPTRIFVDTKDAPIVAGAVHAAARLLATYDRKHLLTQADLIQDRFGITVGTPEAVVATIR